MIIKPFGFPAWKNCKKRVAKKYLKERNLYYRYKEFDGCPINTIVCGCTGLNFMPIEIEPIYVRIGRKAEYLADLDIWGKGESCSFFHCGVGPAKSYEECKAYIEKTVSIPAKDDPWGFAERYSKIVLYEDGTFDWERKSSES